MNIAYVAGMIDADGSIGFTSSRGSYITPRVTITNTNLEFLEMVKFRFGGNIQRLSKRKENWKVGYYWQITNSSAVDFVEKVEPYLIIKKQQCWLLWAWDAIRPGKGRRRTQDIVEAMDLINQESKWLNQRGIGSRASESPVDEALGVRHVASLHQRV